MRKLVVSNIVSLDGFYAGPGDDVLALAFDDGFNDDNAEGLRTADTLLLGRTSFEMFHGYWPTVADDTDASPEEREISGRNNAAEKVVVSDTLRLDPSSAWASSTRVVPRAEARAAVAALKELDGDDILVFGSRTLWNDLLVAGLVDELRLLVGPVLLGDGVPVFTGPRTPLRLREARALAGSSLVVHRYDARPRR